MAFHINEFDLSTLLQTYKKKSKRIIIISVVAGIVGYAIALCIPKIYYSGATLAPEITDEDGMTGGISSLASMAGINLGGGTDAIGPELYPDVVSSNKFVVDLLYTQVQTFDGKITCDYKTYLKKYCRRPWWGYGSVVLGKMMKAINPPQEFTKSDPNARICPERMSREEEMMVEGVKGSISCSIDDKTGVISVGFMAQDPLVAKTMVDTVMSHLQEFIIQYRTNKARIDLAYYQKLEKESKHQYENAQRNYAHYCDTHVGTILQTYVSEQERLENELSLSMNAYTQVKQQVQMAEAKVQENTPAFTIVQGATVANRQSSPKRLLMGLACMFLAAMGCLGWYYVRLLFIKE